MLNWEKIVSAQVTGDGNIVIQNSDNTTITIDTKNIVELRKQITNLQDQLNILSPQILYFSIDFLTNGVSRGMGFSITITNLTKEHRYFTQPSFNLSHPFQGADSFVLTSLIGKDPQFPIRLEYGQPVTVRYTIGQGQIDFFREVMSMNEDASVAVVSYTTVGEIYRSNEHTIKEILSMMPHQLPLIV